jgi:hypothetical protein
VDEVLVLGGVAAGFDTPGTEASRVRKVCMSALPAAVLPSARGITLISASEPLRNDAVFGAETA